MRCAKCGRETPETSQGQAAVRILRDAGWREVVPTQSCAHCGAPISGQRSVLKAPRPFGHGAEATARLQTDQRVRARRSRRPAMVVTGVALVAVVAIIAAVGLTKPSSGRQVTVDQLRPGDCLTGSNLALGTSSQWPYQVTAVPCTQQHLAEVFFAGNAWSQSQTTYPGNSEINSEATDQCNLAFFSYDGIVNSASSFSFDSVTPSGGSDWGSGDRWLVCVAYQGTPVTPISYSLKGSYR